MAFCAVVRQTPARAAISSIERSHWPWCLISPAMIHITARSPSVYSRLNLGGMQLEPPSMRRRSREAFRVGRALRFARRKSASKSASQPAYVGCASQLHSKPSGTPPFDTSGEVGRLAIIHQTLEMRFCPELLVELNKLVGICASVDGGVECSTYLAKDLGVQRGTHRESLSTFSLIAAKASFCVSKSPSGRSQEL